MKPAIVLISLCFVLGACDGTFQQTHKANIQEQKTESTGISHPFSISPKPYEGLIDDMTGEYFSKCPDLDKEHTAKLQLFVKTRYPKAKFMQAVGPEYIAICNRIEKGLHHDAEGNPDEFYMQAHTSFFDARDIVGDLRDVYVAKYVQKIALKTELLETTTGDDRMNVSWVYAEVTVDEFCERLADAPPVHRTVTKNERRKHMDNELEAPADDDIYKIEMWLNDECEVLEGDRFLGFSSPQLTWDIGHGSCGFLHVRNKKIIEIIYTVWDGHGIEYEPTCIR